MNIRWDAEKYRDNFSFVEHYGEALLDMIEGEALSVLDLGCGNGNLTQKLVERGFHVTGLDGSEQHLQWRTGSEFPGVFCRGIHRT